ncbi:MAG: hypothetical protein VX185_05085 [Pseudomonadota bacterium]|nr:hypothetical protein [Pseudomonadota bacterium]
MSNRVVLVNGNQAAADGAAEFIMGTYVGVGAVLYGVYWLVGYFTPVLLANDLGYLTYQPENIESVRLAVTSKSTSENLEFVGTFTLVLYFFSNK